MTVALSVHIAIHNVVSSVALLVSGYPVPAGNSMRQYVEALAMALLFSDESLTYYERFQANRMHFNASTAPDKLRIKKVGKSIQRRLDITSDGWDTLIATRDFYHKHSHNSVVAREYLMDWRSGFGAVLGAHYDPEKRDFYETELRGRHTALRALESVVEVFDRCWAPPTGGRGDAPG